MQARGKKVAVLLPNHFNANLFNTLRNCIVGGGGSVIIVGFDQGEPLTDSTRKKVVTIELATDAVKDSDYDAVVILDSSTPEEMKASRRNLNLISKSFENRKPIGAVDRGVELLVAALGSQMKGRKVTGPVESRIDLEGSGSDFVDQDVVADELLITARSTDDVEKFCQVLFDQIGIIGGLAA